MSVKHIGTTVAALTLGLALIASTPAGAAPTSTSAVAIETAIDSSVITVARQQGNPTFRAQQAPNFRAQRAPNFRAQRAPNFRAQRAPNFRAQRTPGLRPGLRTGAPRLGRTAHIRSGWFRPGRRLWVYPFFGAGLLALTLAPGWYWGDYYDDCLRWIIPCPGCAPVLVDLCEPY